MAHDKTIKAYELVAGKGNIDEDDEKGDLPNPLPTDIPGQLQWRLSLPEQYEEFKHHVEPTSHGMLFRRGKFPNMNLLDENQAAVPAGDQETDPFGDAVVAAVMKQWGNHSGGSGGRQQPGSRAPRSVVAAVWRGRSQRLERSAVSLGATDINFGHCCRHVGTSR